MGLKLRANSWFAAWKKQKKRNNRTIQLIWESNKCCHLNFQIFSRVIWFTKMTIIKPVMNNVGSWPGSLEVVWLQNQMLGRVYHWKEKHTVRAQYIFFSLDAHGLDFDVWFWRCAFSGVLLRVNVYLRVVVLDHLTHRPQSRQVLVQPIWTHVVERVRRARITIRASEVDPHLQCSYNNYSSVLTCEHSINLKSNKLFSWKLTQPVLTLCFNACVQVHKDPRDLISLSGEAN